MLGPMSAYLIGSGFTGLVGDCKPSLMARVPGAQLLFILEGKKRKVEGHREK
jgi:hypothetical protein